MLEELNKIHILVFKNNLAHEGLINSREYIHPQTLAADNAS